jgi:hypothetical protein
MPSTPDPIDSLTVTRRGLEAASAQWAHLLLFATVIVGVGVVIEVIAFVMEILEDKRKGDVKFHDGLALAGAIYVALFIGYEIRAEYKGGIIEEELRTNNSAAQAILSDRANSATAQAVALAKKVGGFDVLVGQTNDKVDALAATASDQKARSDAIIAALNAKQKEVAATIEAAKKDEATLAASANTITELRQQLHDLTTDRSIDINRVSAEVKPLGKVPFALTVSDDVDAMLLAGQIATALEKAGWDWKENKPSDNSLEFVKKWPDKPAMRVQPGRGVVIVLAVVDLNNLGAAGTKLIDALKHGGLKDVSGLQLDDDQMKQAKRLYGVIHVFVGSKY